MLKILKVLLCMEVKWQFLNEQFSNRRGVLMRLKVLSENTDGFDKRFTGSSGEWRKSKTKKKLIGGYGRV